MSAPTIQPAVDGLWNCDAATYHADCEYISHSMLEEFRDSIPRYAGLFVTKTIQPEDRSGPRALGSAVHAFVLQPDIANDLLVVWPEGDGKKAEVQKARQAVCPAAGNAADPKVRTVNGRTIVKKGEWEQAQRMADAARAHPLVREMVDLPGYCEQSVRVECPEVGKIKARFDKLFYEGHILDIKTTRHLNSKAYAKDAYNLGYFRQAPHYEDVRATAMRPGLGIFLQCVISSLEPYETVVYQLDEIDIADGRAENRELLYELRKRQRDNDWSSRLSGLQRLSAPGWARKQNGYRED